MLRSEAWEFVLMYKQYLNCQLVTNCQNFYSNSCFVPVHTGAFWLVMLAAVAARHRTASRMRRFDRFQRNCIFSLSMHPKKLKLFVWPSNISAGVNLTLRLLAEPWREPSTVTSIPRAIVTPSTIVHWLGQDLSLKIALFRLECSAEGQTSINKVG